MRWLSTGKKIGLILRSPLLPRFKKNLNGEQEYTSIQRNKWEISYRDFIIYIKRENKYICLSMIIIRKKMHRQWRVRPFPLELKFATNI